MTEYHPIAQPDCDLCRALSHFHRRADELASDYIFEVVRLGAGPVDMSSAAGATMVSLLQSLMRGVIRHPEWAAGIDRLLSHGVDGEETDFSAERIVQHLAIAYPQEP